MRDAQKPSKNSRERDRGVREKGRKGRKRSRGTCLSVIMRYSVNASSANPLHKSVIGLLCIKQKWRGVEIGRKQKKTESFENPTYTAGAVQ